MSVQHPRSGAIGSGVRRAAGVAFLLAVLAACGSADPSPTSADGASFGVDRTSWPGTMAAARDVLATLPEDVGAGERELMLAEPADGESDYAGVAYGDRLSVVVSDDELGLPPGSAPDVAGAQAKLAGMFGLVYACDPDTYEGTIERSPGAAAPGLEGVDPGKPAWFACRIDSAEGAEDFSAHAVGWTSSGTAWLVVGPDDAAVRNLVTALHAANS